MKTLLIVESPAKSKTIEKLLGNNFIVLSSFGHIRNLDSKSLGIDVDDNFKPNYKILTDRNKQIKSIQETIKKVDRVFLAADEDREGEAIAWHCAIVFKLDVNALNRICFHEITKTALEHAVANPRQINMPMVHSQQARRILDRLVGFKLSPLLWKYILPKLSAGRVQSSALKVIIDQEKEIEKHTEKKYYKTIGTFANTKISISANLNINFEEETIALKFLDDCKKTIFTIISISKKTVEKRPPPPYITSTVQQDIGIRFGIGSKQIMGILQKLYENGVITYHRTDSTNLSKNVQDQIKEYVLTVHGKDYLHPRTYNSKIKCAQEAHEAIRPTYIEKTELDGTFDEFEKKIYDIIWKRTVASQMSASISDVYTINIGISNSTHLFIIKNEKLIFDGYRKIYDDTVGEDEVADEKNDICIDNIKENDILSYIKISSTEKYKTPPPRYSEASLIKKMEKIGIGRPSTYSNIIETVINRKYVEKKDIKGLKVDVNIYTLEKNNVKSKKEKIVINGEKKKIVPTDLGMNVITFLETNFANILDTTFTSNLEENLDEIANGITGWTETVKEFYDAFIPNVDKLNDKKLVSQCKNDKKRLVGINDEGKNVYTYIAKYGSIFQIGEIGEDVKYVKLDSKYSINTVSMKDYEEITKFPKNIGMYKNKDVLVKNGMYGFYISYDGKNYKFLEGMDENIGLDDGIKCIDEVNDGNDGNDGNVSNTLVKKIDKYTINNGKYGYYIIFNNKFYSIPKDYDVKTLTKEMCDVIIKIPKKVFKKK
jgi:DNA topoisomerase-1